MGFLDEGVLLIEIEIGLKQVMAQKVELMNFLYWFFFSFSYFFMVLIEEI